MTPIELSVVTWNLYHGRAVPPAHRELLHEFGDALGSWSWDVALLQEVPPWWPAPLAARLRAESRRVLTSRNSLLAARRAVARRWPDLIKSGGGGCNAILVRGRVVVEHRAHRLRRLPERRMLHGVRLASGVWLANLHAGGSVHEAELGAAVALRWAAGAPLVLGGDFNIHRLALRELFHAAGHGPDHVFVRGLTPSERGRPLERGTLSDHAPVLAVVTG